jgi:4-aminobutyrate aminotransferase-like enzyme/Ser/Thr protein kinase RdoA (MazF antagonist)
LLALRTTPPGFTDAQAERIARDTYGLAVSVRPLPGERDRNFHLSTADRREYVLKIIDFNASPEATDCQLKVLAHLAEQDPGLPVPRVLPTVLGGEVGTVTGRDGSYVTCLIGFLPGSLLAEFRPDAPLLESLGDALARIDAALRGFFHPALGQRLAWDVRRLPELIEHAPLIGTAVLRRAVENVSAALRERLPVLRSLGSQAVHGDCHPYNLLVDPDTRSISGILDFGDMIHAPRVLEPAVAMSELLTEDLAPVEALSPLLAAYAKRQPLEAAEVDVLFDLIAARHAITILVHGWRTRHDPEGARVLEKGAVCAARSLERLHEVGREVLTERWQISVEAGTVGAPAVEAVDRPAVVRAAAMGGVISGREDDTDTAPVDLMRRRRLMGAGAELFYEQPLHLVRGSGLWLFDAEGREYLDVYNNVPHVGHAHPRVVAAIQRQTAILATHTRYLHGRILEYAERLTATMPAHLDACIFVNSGSEANDVAWRIAQFATGHKGGVVMAHAYHGITDAVAALTPSTGQPRDPRVVTLAAPPADVDVGQALSPEQAAAARQDAERAVRALAERGLAPAAFFLDTAITSTGIFDPPAAWADAVTAPIRGAGGLIVADEVQYGLGRPGSHMWGFERRGLRPDLVTLGKPVANGYPMGVVVANRSLIEAFQKEFGFFSTFGGNAVAAAAALTVLDVIEREGLMANANATGGYLRERLTALGRSHPSLGAVRGRGLLLGLEVNATGGLGPRAGVKRIINHVASQSRVLIGYEGPEASLLKLRPPMPFRPEHADRLVAAIEAAARTLEPGP